jgi:hypothetical protein
MLHECFSIPDFPHWYSRLTRPAHTVSGTHTTRKRETKVCARIDHRLVTNMRRSRRTITIPFSLVFLYPQTPILTYGPRVRIRPFRATLDDHHIVATTDFAHVVQHFGHTSVVIEVAATAH